MPVLRGILGLAAMILIAWALSSNRKKINWSLVGAGVILQLVIAALVLYVPIVESGINFVVQGFLSINDATREASRDTIFNNLMDSDSFGFIFAFQVLPTIIFFSALTSLLYYLGILQWIVFIFAWIMSKTMRLSGAESLSAAGNVFVGQTEAPLLVKPYLEKMTKSEIMCMMTGGMATIAGGVFAAYMGFLGGEDDAARQLFGKHLLTASIMSAPAAIVAAKIIFPEKNPEATDRTVKVPKDKIGSNILDAISKGTTDGLKLAVNVGAMLIVFTALIYLLNMVLLWFGGMVGINEQIVQASNGQFSGLSLQYLLGWVMAPIAWLLGVTFNDSQVVGQLLGEKTMINEFFAYLSMSKMQAAEIFNNERSVIIATYALCGFSNFASIGIQIGGIGAIAPGQRKNLASLGFRALIAGTIACFMTATIAGMMVKI